MVVFPNCKINIGLRVIRKREDGYHDLETVFYPVYALHDRLLIEPANTFSYTQTGIPLDCNAEDNLVVRCYRRMCQLYPSIPPVRIVLDKHIPSGAGLGGGSSDAAHTAVALNQLFSLQLSRKQLAEIVTPLGADCPFFIYNTPCFATGIGDQLQPIELDLSRFRIVLIKPATHVSTREAYAGIQRHPEAQGSILHAAMHQDWSRLTNDFEETVFPLYPDLATIKQQLLNQGAVYAAMSGSGSTLFGLFELNAEDGRTWSAGLQVETPFVILLDDTLAQS